MKLRNGTLVDGILDVNPAATSVIAQHNASTPLLKLPLEVKNLIYEYTLGGRLIHIAQNRGGGGVRFKSTVCCACLSEEEAQDDFDSDNTDHWNAPAIEDRHDYCWGAYTEVVDLGLLRSCRQVYNEAHFIPYSTNTFSCHEPGTLQSFVLSIAQGTKNNHLAIRSLFLDMVYNGPDDGSLWKKAIATCVRKLKAIQKVNISIDLRDLYCFPSYGDLTSDGKCGRNDLVTTFRGLKKLPLKTATLVISDNEAWQCDEYYSNLLHRYSLDEKRDWVRDLKAYILQSNS
ncbi:hypothetical protein BDR22DRAFT_963485 [Usnea florida]